LTDLATLVYDVHKKIKVLPPSTVHMHPNEMDPSTVHMPTAQNTHHTLHPIETASTMTIQA